VIHGVGTVVAHIDDAARRIDARSIDEVVELAVGVELLPARGDVVDGAFDLVGEGSLGTEVPLVSKRVDEVADSALYGRVGVEGRGDAADQRRRVG
jgi:hypothetical protein